MHGKFQLGMSKGPFKSLYLQVLSGIALHNGEIGYNLDAHNWHVVHRDPHPNLTAIQDTVIDLCKRDLTHELFGLNYVTLMDMDYPTFSKLKKVILELCKSKEESLKTMKDNMKVT